MGTFTRCLLAWMIALLTTSPASTGTPPGGACFQTDLTCTGDPTVEEIGGRWVSLLETAEGLKMIFQASEVQTTTDENGKEEESRDERLVADVIMGRDCYQIREWYDESRIGGRKAEQVLATDPDMILVLASGKVQERHWYPPQGEDAQGHWRPFNYDAASAWGIRDIKVVAPSNQVCFDGALLQTWVGRNTPQVLEFRKLFAPPEQEGHPSLLQFASLLGSEEIDGENCYQIEFRFPESEDTETFWFSCETSHLIRWRSVRFNGLEEQRVKFIRVRNYEIEFLAQAPHIIIDTD